MGELKHDDRSEAEQGGKEVGDRESLGDDLFDAMSTMLRDINKTQEVMREGD